MQVAMDGKTVKGQSRVASHSSYSCAYDITFGVSANIWLLQTGPLPPFHPTIQFFCIHPGNLNLIFTKASLMFLF